jgi:adenylate cyclase, class 1
VYCGGATFAQAELGEAFHAQLAAHIRSLRQSTERYPVYITDLDLSALAPDTDAPLQTVHYLREKQRLEAAINRALAGTV